uniref:CIS tube protein n=1 Tax=Ningiella ruwaisensis TaxID=2364274 RepID=UPI00109FE149|nr:hypothetical protein [Ningiella ruwaisensis]
MASGLLDKLKILPFASADTIQGGLPVDVPFVCQFNPESFTVDNEIIHNTDQVAHGSNGAEAREHSIAPREFSFDFLLDGTGANGAKIDVSVYIEWFKRTTGFFGETHRSRFLLIQWGLFAATCVLKKYSINYKLFKASGLPLRATISATFIEHKTLELQELINNLQSPDVTEMHRVAPNERLDTIVHKKYGDYRYIHAVAKANKLDTIRKLSAADTLRLPPLKGAQ